MDERNKKLAYNLVNMSCRVQPGERVLVSGSGSDSFGLVREVIKAVSLAGGIPSAELFDPSVSRELLLAGSPEMFALRNDCDMHKLMQTECWININATDNTCEMSDVPQDKLKLYAEKTKETLDRRVNHTKWVILHYPNGASAQQAKMSKEAFADYYYDVCCLDYAKMSKAMEPLKALMERTDKVRLTGGDTDISFSIKGLPAIPCAGECNIPDGEIFTAPVKNSINGRIHYNTPSLYEGTVFEDICFDFENGKIVKAAANHTKKLNDILDRDEGARYVGEFSFGLNPYITDPMMNTLFDEKIAGSFHFTPGAAYEECDNGNKSVNHWDLVFIQTPEYGGGEIYFDDKLIRKDGRFVLPELEALNPENLK